MGIICHNSTTFSTLSFMEDFYRRQSLDQGGGNGWNGDSKHDYHLKCILFMVVVVFSK